MQGRFTFKKMSFSVFSSTAEPCKLPDSAAQDEYNKLSDEIQVDASQLKMLNFMRRRIKLEMSSFAHLNKLDAPALNVLVSAKVEEFQDNVFRFFLTLFEPKTKHILSEYFDKVIVNVGNEHFEWTRNVDSLELDGLEFVLSNPVFPITVSYVLYPDFPVMFFQIPDDLKSVTKSNYDCLSRIVRSINHYAAEHGLINDENVLFCDEALGGSFKVEQVKLSQLPMIIQSHLLPLAPIRTNFTLDVSKPRYNIYIKLPNFANLPQPTGPIFTSEILDEVKNFAALKENVDLLCAINRNPFEAIEAEIAGHAAYCELSDEANDNGPKVSINPMNPARRSTPFYWQSWVPDYAQHFLEENKLVHDRYIPK